MDIPWRLGSNYYLDTIPVSFACSIAFMLVMKPTIAPEVSASTGIESTPKQEIVNMYL